MRRAAKIDANQNSIVRSLRKIPKLSVCIISAVGKGVPDLLIGSKVLNYLVELKDGEKVKSQQKLTPDEVQWHEAWKGQVKTCNCLEDILKILNL